MNKAILSGRLYNGKTHGYTQEVKGGDDIERKVFRGRLNFRTPAGDYDWIDVVCFKDAQTEKGGLVGWLEKEYLGPERDENGKIIDADETDGKAIELSGHLRVNKTKKVKTDIKSRKTGKVQEIEVVVPSIEFIIEDASFVPSDAGIKHTSEEVDFDDDEFDDIEVVDKNTKDDDDDEEEEVVEEPKKKKSSAKESKKNTKSSKQSKKSKKDEEEDDFFED